MTKQALLFLILLLLPVSLPAGSFLSPVDSLLHSFDDTPSHALAQSFSRQLVAEEFLDEPLPYTVSETGEHVDYTYTPAVTHNGPTDESPQSYVKDVSVGDFIEVVM